MSASPRFVVAPLVVFAAACLPPKEAQQPQTRIAADTSAAASTARGEKTLALFKELAKLYRPSGKEEAVRAWIVKLVDDTNRRAGREIAKHEQDQVGNLIVRLEGTGRFQQSQTPIALQSHMDMIHAVKDAAPGEDLTPYFQNGVVLEESNGLLHTKDFKTTLGADDGIGLAMMLRYLTEVEEERPPLELLFTMSEEQGLVGAKKLALPMKATVLLNLDTSIGETFIYGCLGSQRVFARGTVAGTPLPADWRVMKLSLSGLKGGHSGKVIHEKRLNAIVGIAQAVRKVKEGGEASLLDLKAGAEAALNVIPDGATALVAVPAERLEEARAAADAELRAALAAATAEDPAVAKALVDVPPTNDGAPQVGLDAERLDKLLQSVLAVRNGVISTQADYPNGVNTSSNLGWLSVVAEGDALAVRTGLMLRSYVFDEITRYGGEAATTLKGVADGIAVDPVPPSPPWLAKTDGWLFKLAKETVPEYKTSLTAGGIEPAAFGEKFPSMTMLSLGAAIHDVHAPGEALELASMSQTADVVDRLVHAVAASETHRAAPAALRAPRESILLRALEERASHEHASDGTCR